MTVSYTHLSHTAGWVGGLMRLLFLWKGSLFKQVWPDFLFFFGVYFLLSALYRLILVEYEDSKVAYELFCVYCEKFSKVIPISFLLGFYVTQVVSRWWSQFMTLPWPDTLARYLAVYMPGTDQKSRNYRRTICRWVNLGNVLALRLVSYKVMVRFPTYEHLVESGLATHKEMIQLKQMDDLVVNKHQITWFPNMWAQNLLRKARREGLVENDWFSHVLIKEVDSMANMNGMLICYGWISIPLVYTQVVTLAVYAYFVACLFGRQYLLPTQYRSEGDMFIPVSDFPTVSNWTGTRMPGAVNIVGYDNDVADFYIPIFTILEYLFYMGWLKVAETLLNPFGEDDDDFDTYYLIDRNLQVSYIMSDEAGLPVDPEMDPFDFSNAPELKHTNLSAQFLDDERPHMPTDNLNLTAEQTNIASSTSLRSSKLNVNIGSKINLAGSILATPVTVRRRSSEGTAGVKSVYLEVPNGAPGMFVTAPKHQATTDISQVNNTASVQDSQLGISTPTSTRKNVNSSPLSSRNDRMLFSVHQNESYAGPEKPEIWQDFGIE
eukprot:GFUD01007960.1.p1 GENE.GFUD01007960.1~~GFUD01007960.1.p1  ORF type:complete len:548 (-),score=81.86 GFUD01007960.1:485-2128(-)